MSEELLQRDLLNKPEKIGKWDFYNIGATNIKSLISNKLIKNLSYPLLNDKRKPDGIIIYKGEVIAIISNKLPKKLVKDKEITDWIDVTKSLKSKLLIITDVKTSTFWINALTGKQIKNESGNQLKTLFDPASDKLPKLIESILNSIDEKNNQIILPELKDPTSLAKSVWQDIWMASGDDAENCLYTFVELFIFKYLSDLGILTGNYSFNQLLKRYEQDEPEEVLDYYVRFIRTQIKTKFPEDKLDGTTIINGSTFINKKGEPVSGYSTVFKKVLEQFKDYEKKYGKFDHIHYEFKSKVFETFLKQSISKKNWGQYFTPLKVVRAVVKMAKSDIREGMTIGDPACGVGKFLLEVIAENPNKYFKIEKSNVVNKINLIGYDKGFIDKEQKTIILAKANMLIYLSDLIRENPKYCIEFSNQFNNAFKLQTRTTLGTLVNPEISKYDIILTNPPYVTSGIGTLKDEIKAQGLEYHYTVNSSGIEGLFMEWIIKALRPDGKAFVIVPDGILTRTTDKKLREYITNECFVEGIISLPKKTFFTTQQKTAILIIIKKENRNDKQDFPVFTYLASEIGETLDINRFETSTNHLDDGAELFTQFKNSKTRFKTNNQRCKIQPIEKITTETVWNIDAWWDEKEKIALGIKEETDKIKLKDYNNLTLNVIKAIEEQKNILTGLEKLVNEKVQGYKEVKLGDKKLFNLFIGKRVLKKDVRQASGHIPLYSANVFKPFAFLSKGNITKFDYNVIMWGIDGDFEFNVLRKDMPFATTDHCGTIQILDNGINPHFLLYQLGQTKSNYEFDRTYRASLTNMKDFIVKIPITKSGVFDTKAQDKIAEIFQKTEESKRVIEEQMNYLLKPQIVF